MSGRIVPKNLAQGVDFCGVKQHYYIVRSDLTCYMRSTNLHTGANLDVFSLHPSCRGGDHYLAHKSGIFYIIKENSYRSVTNLTTDEDFMVYIIHPNCRGGDHYLSASDYFYVIYQEKGFYHRTKNLSTDMGGEDFVLHPKCGNGLYYFGIDDCCCFMKPYNQWAIQFRKSTNLSRYDNPVTFSFHPSVINFLPGGLGVTIGPACGEWIPVDSIRNNSEVPLELHKMISRIIGYEKEKMSSIEHKWNISLTVTEETECLMALIAKSQFSLPAEYGGCNVNTDNETWSEVTNVELTVSVDVQPHQEICIWLYQLGLGNEPVLFCRDMNILDSWSFPGDSLLPPAENLTSDA